MEFDPLVLLDITRCDSIHRILLQEAFKQVAPLGAEGFGDAQPVKLGVFLLLGEGSLPGQHLVHQDSDAPAVDFVGIELAVDNFGRDVVHGAAEGLAGLGRVDGPAEVRELEGAAEADDVLGLDVAVHDSGLVQVADGRCDLGHEQRDGVLVQRSLLHDAVVQVALAHLHHQVGLLAPHVQSVRRQDVRVRAEEVDLALVDEKVQLDVLLPERLHRQHQPAHVRQGQQDLPGLALPHLPDHLELVLRLLRLYFPHHPQGLVELPAHLRLLPFLPEVLLGLVRLIIRARPHLPPQVLKNVVILAARGQSLLLLLLDPLREEAQSWRFLLGRLRFFGDEQFELVGSEFARRLRHFCRLGSDHQRLAGLRCRPHSINALQPLEDFLRARLEGRTLIRAAFLGFLLRADSHHGYNNCMPEGTYAFNKSFSEEECEADSIHGICENEQRQITFTAPNLFKYAYHYYYEYENSSYKMVDQVQNDTVFSGTYEMEGNRIVGAILAGEQAAADKVK